MTVVWIDTHAHLDDPAFDDGREAVIENALAAGVSKVVNIGYRPHSWATTLALAKDHPEVAYALGLHPAHADEFSAATLDRLARLLEETEPVAVGEIGLDFFREGPPRALQEEALRQQLRLAIATNLPAVIHQRAAESELLAVLEAEAELHQLVLHSFEGSDRYAGFARERECVIGVGGLATRAGSTELRRVLGNVDPDRVVLETDAPYLVPSGVRRRRNEPALIPCIADSVCRLWSIEAPDFAARTTATAAATFSIELMAVLGGIDDGGELTGYV